MRTTVFFSLGFAEDSITYDHEDLEYDENHLVISNATPLTGTTAGKYALEIVYPLWTVIRWETEPFDE